MKIIIIQNIKMHRRLSRNIFRLEKELEKAKVGVHRCEDNFGTVWLTFDDTDEMDKFLTIVISFDNDPASMCNRAAPYYAYPKDKEEELNSLTWTYHPYVNCTRYIVEDSPIKNTDYSGDQTGEIYTTMGLRFPHCDLDEVLTRLKSFNK